MRVGLAVMLMVVAVPCAAWGSSRPGGWTTYAHDFQRTARADGKGDMKAPVVAWSTSLGATLSANQVAFADLDLDGRTDMAALDGGRVVGTDATGKQMWIGPSDAASKLLGVWNLDGAASPEIVVQTPNGIDVLNGKTGTLDTTIADIADTLDATFVSLGSGGGVLVIASTNGFVHAYDFRGTLKPAATMWTGSSDVQTQYLVGDVDGDSSPDLVRPLSDGFDVLDPKTGLTKYGPVTLGPTAYRYQAMLSDLDGQPGLEIVAIDYSYLYSPSAGIYAMGVRGGALKTLWSSAVTATTALTTDFTTVASGVADLDGDGKVEVVFSQWDDNKAEWDTNVVDGSTGTSISTAKGQFIQAIDDIDGDGKLEVITRSTPTADRTPARSTVVAFDFDDRTTGLVKKSWTVDHSRIVMLSNLQTNGLQVALPIPVTGDFEPTSVGTELLIASDTKKANFDTVFETLRSDGTFGATLTVPTSGMQALWRDSKLTASTSHDDLALYSGDGVAHIVSHSFVESANFTAGSFAGASYIAALSSTKSAIFAPTSTNDLLWFDGAHLHSNGQPYVLQDTPHIVQSGSWGIGGWAFDPVVPLDATSPLFATYQQNDGTVSVVALDSSGVEVWRTALAAGTQVLPPATYTADYTGDGIPDLLITVSNVHSLESLVLVDGWDGHIVRSTPLAAIESGSDLLAQGALIDVNKDGVLDLVGNVQSRGTIAIDLSVAPMSELWLLPNDGHFLLGTTGAAVLSGGTTDLFRAGGDLGFGKYARIQSNGSLITSADEGFAVQAGGDRNHPALVARGGGNFDFVTVGMAAPTLSRVMRIAGDTLDSVWTVYASGGKISSVAPTSGVALHDPLEVDVDGDGVEDVVFGGDDGYVYAVRSTDGSLVFSTNLTFPVAFVVAADIDADPALELVVGTTDGKLIALDDLGKYTATIDTSLDGGVSDGGVLPPDGGALPDAGCAPPDTNGCSCKLGESKSSAPLPALFLASTVGLFLIRRKRR